MFQLRDAIHPQFKGTVINHLQAKSNNRQTWPATVTSQKINRGSTMCKLDSHPRLTGQADVRNDAGGRKDPVRGFRHANFPRR